MFIGSAASTGGIAGAETDNFNITISKCYNSGTISGVASGGIITWANCVQIQDCYNTGEIYSTTDYSTGGITGWINQNSSIINSYNVGKVSKDTSIRFVGGLLGNYSNVPTLINCYSSNTSYTYAVGGGDIASCWATLENDWDGHIEVKTYEDMKKIASQLGDNWAEDTNNINNGYPILKWQVEEQIGKT